MWLQLAVVAALVNFLAAKAGVITCYNDQKECYSYSKSECHFRNDMYTGTRNTTMDGFPCKKWKDAKSRNEQPENYCRLIGPYYGPWCYTTSPVAEWQYCFVDCLDCYNRELNCFYYGKTGCKSKYAYVGTNRHTVDGILCQRWDKNKPHKPYSSSYRVAPENYCRNPVGNWKGPWCYTTGAKRWDLCFMDCEKLNCYNDEKKCFNYGNPKCQYKYKVYNGTWNTTVSGRSCQKWKANSPHNSDSAYEEEIENYCRNPSPLNAKGPWCYTTDKDKRWELCFKDCADVTGPPPRKAGASTTPGRDSQREIVEVCRDKPVDLLVLMDGSNSIKPINFTKEKELVINIMKKLPADSRISVMQFSTNYRWELRFNSGLSLGRIQSRIKAIKYMNHKTYTAKALKAALNEVLKHNSKNMTMLTITDGVAQDWKPNNGSFSSWMIRTIGVKSYAVGIGKDTNSTQLEQIVGNADHILTAKFSELDDEFAKRVVEKICTTRFDNGLNGSGQGSESHKDSTEDEEEFSE